MGIIEAFLGKKRPENQTPAEIAEALAKAQSSLVDERQALESLARKRAEILLRGTDSDLAAHDQEADGVQRSADRMAAAVEHLGELLEQAQARKAEGDLDGLVEEAAGLTTRYAELLGRYGQVAAEMVQILEEMRGADLRVDGIGRILRDSKRQIPARPNILLRPQNRPLHEVAHIPAATEDGAFFPSDGAGVRFQRQRQEYTGAVHELPPKPGGVFDADGNEMHGRGRLVGGRRRD